MRFKTFHYLDDLKKSLSKYGQVSYYATTKKSNMPFQDLRQDYEPDLLFLDETGDFGFTIEFKDFSDREGIPLGALTALSKNRNAVESRYPFLSFVFLTKGRINDYSKKMLNELNVIFYELKEYKGKSEQLAELLVNFARENAAQKSKTPTQVQQRKRIVIFEKLLEELTEVTHNTRRQGTPNIVNSIQSHRVLIYNHETKSISSGTLVDIGPTILVLTTSHSIEGIGIDSIFINLGIPYQDCSYMIKRIWTEPKLDVAYLELDSVEVRKYLRDILPFRFGKRAEFSAIAPRYRAVALIGYPSVHATVNNQKRIFDVETFYVLSQILPHERWPMGIDADPKKHMLIEYGTRGDKQFIDQYGKIVEEIKHPGGMSGASVWKFNPEDMYSEKPTYGLIGIQTSWYRAHQLLRATIIDPLLSQLEKDFGSIL